MSYNPRKRSAIASSGSVIPDSEDECQRASFPDNVIVITSDEEEPEERPAVPIRKQADKPFMKPKTPRRARKIVKSSDEDVSDSKPSAQDIIDITDSSEDDNPMPKASKASLSRTTIGGGPLGPSKIDFATIVDGGAILRWDAPRSPARPFRTPSGFPKDDLTSPSTPKRMKAAPRLEADSADASGSFTPAHAPKTRPNSKKAQAEALQQRLATYAQELFSELNEKVFEKGLPAELDLIWSKTLQVTAGRASYKRNRDRMEFAKIELAVKVLDCEDRVKHTLAHEMCHLACWLINKAPKENHGALFKAWGARVHSRRPDIVVSTTHNYEINYKYNWKCAVCDLAYGRHSKSIKPEDTCGRCKEGVLVPQFTTRTRKAPDTPKISRMAPSKAQHSPLRLSSSPEKTTAKKTNQPTDDLAPSEGASDWQDYEVDVLTTIFGATSLC